MMKITKRLNFPRKTYRTYVGILLLFLATGCNSNFKVNDQSKANAQSSNNAISTSLANNQRPLDANFVCYNTNTLFVESWQNPDFHQAVKKLNPRILRLPGGTESQYWDWQKGSWIDNLNQIRHPYMRQVLRQIESKKGRYQASLKDMQAGLKATNTVPLFVLNILTSDLESQLSALRQARDLGLPVKYVQIGNEPFYNLPDNKQAFPTAQAYADTARQWTNAVKKEFPQAKVTVIGFDPASAARTQDSRLQTWNDSVLQTALPDADAIAIHVYRGSMLNSPLNSSNDYPFFSQEDVPLILHVPFRAWQTMQNSPQFQNIPNNKEIWITEYNFMSAIHSRRQKGKPRIIGSWAHGLFAMAMSLLFLEQDNISHICNHVLIGSSDFGAILSDSKLFIDPTKKTQGNKFALTATGSALSLLGNATEGMTTAQKINFANSPLINVNNNFQYPALYGWKFSNQNKSSAIIMNLSDQNLNININSIFKQNVNYKQLSGNPRDLVTAPTVLLEKQGKTSPKLVLPAYSVTLFN